MKCPQCRSEIGDDSRFCKVCGAGIRSGFRPEPVHTKTLVSPALILNQGDVLEGRYEILGKIGEGGMGEVYRALDRNLDRVCAVKILPAAFAEDKERLARFEREAKLLATLNHPNIASIYGLEQSGDQRFLVLELAEGETLQEKLNKGPMELEDALELCRQVCDGLGAAHEKGVIHRDLKPGNIMVSPGGEVKILDFGLAKAFGGEETSTDIEKSPTITAQMTKPGMVLGTAAYMSPEQARGRSVDKKTDIWAFGCLFFECLTGVRAFVGETVSDTIAHILKVEPEWGKLPSATPPIIRTLLRRCLQKDPKRRLHDIADAGIEIEDFQTGTAAELSPELRARPKWLWLPWALAAVFLIVSLVLVKMLSRPSHHEPPIVQHFMINLPENAPVAPAGSAPLSVVRPSLALSPDGRRLVYVALVGEQTQLCVRRIDQSEAVPIPGTEGAHTPFFSPDGDWVGFFADEKVKKVSLSGGEPEVVCSESWFAFGGTWGPDGTIYFVPSQHSSIWKVPVEGGDPQRLTEVDIQKNDIAHHWPSVLPGGNYLLFDAKGGGIAAISLRSGERKEIHERGSYPRYVPTGHLVYIEDDKLFAAPFDLSRLEITGKSTAVLEGFSLDDMGAAQFTFSQEGTLVFIPGGLANEANLTWANRDGGSEALGLPRGRYGSFKLSPDGKKLALPIVEEDSSHIWIYDLERKMPIQLTFGQQDSQPLWTPDNQWIVYRSVMNGRSRVVKKRADGSGEAVQVSDEFLGRIIGPMSVSFDGKLVSFVRFIDGSYDPWILPLEGQQEPRPFFQSPFFESYPAFSPDGKWMSYTSDESGKWEVYVRPYPGPGGKTRISTGGGEEARWSKDGREMFYRFGSRWYVVDVESGAEFSAGTPRLLFEGPYINIGGYSYDVSPDGRRFLVVSRPEHDLATGELHVITNWFEELKRLAPTR